MARWNDEQFHTQVPPETIQCATCVHRLKPVTVLGYTQPRYGYAMCDKYDAKPVGVLHGTQACTEYVKEE